jgi:hypothetical protein
MPIKIDGTNGVLQAYDYQVLTTGFSYTFAAGTQTLVANSAGTLATGTITMPAAPADGMTITITTIQQITALTIAGNTGQSIGGTQVTLMAANSALSFVYRLANTTWYRTSAPALGNIGTAPVYAARAWVNFDGTGTPAIRASGNVSSITDNGTGDYTVNFTTAMPDVNYAAFGLSQGIAIFQGTETTTTYRIQTYTFGAVLTDYDTVNVAIFR